MVGSEDAYISGGVCRDGFGVEEARVACRHMGLSGGRLLPGDPSTRGQAGEGLAIGTSERIQVSSRVQCKGYEDRLDQCTFVSTFWAKCASDRVVHISCDGEHRFRQAYLPACMPAGLHACLHALSDSRCF